MTLLLVDLVALLLLGWGALTDDPGLTLLGVGLLGVLLAASLR